MRMPTSESLLDVWPAAKGAVESSATVPCDPTSAMTLHQACLYPATRRTTLYSSSVREHEFPDLIDRLPAKRRVSVSNNSFKRVGHTSLLSCTKASSVWELLLLHVSARGLRYAVVYKSIFWVFEFVVTQWAVWPNMARIR